MSAAHRATASYRGAVDRTRAQAGELLSFGTEPPDDAAAQRVVQALDHPGRLLDELFKDLQAVRIDNLPRGELTNRAVPLLVIGQQMLRRWGAKGDVELDVFAEALTALLVACHREPYDLRGHRHVTHVVREYLTAHAEAPDLDLTVPRELMRRTRERADFDALAAVIPWLLWWAPESLDGPGGRSVDAEELVQLLVLTRPCVQQRFAGERPVEQPLPDRFTRLFRCGMDRAPLERLAKALGCLLDAPARAATQLDALRTELPPAVYAAAQALVEVELSAVTDLSSMLAVRVDDATGPRAVFVNLTPSHMLHLELPGRAVTLPPLGLDQPKVAGYCSEPLPIDPRQQLSRGGRAFVALDVPMPPMAGRTNFTNHFLPPEVFRGRKSQLAALQMSIQQRDHRTGSLIYGPRRAGKSTLMDHVRQDGALGWSVFLDVANGEHRVSSFDAWNRDTARRLVREVCKPGRLPGFVPSSEDFVTTLEELDRALDDGGPPVAVALDELDVLLLPEQGGDGPRTAGRLGSLVFANLVVIGTAQRFHKSMHEFKNWDMVECPADLTWADGVTYFFGPLHENRDGPRVEWLTWAGVTPRHFTDLIYPAVGLRPYFWAQLRRRLEREIRADPSRSRLAAPDLIQAQLADLVANDGHLSLVTDRGELLTPAERRLKDFFSDEERQILLHFATRDRPGTALTKAAAEAIGGTAAVDELVDRAYLTHDKSTDRLTVAVRVYEDFLRSRVSVLREVTPDASPQADLSSGDSGRRAAEPQDPSTRRPPVTRVWRAESLSETPPMTTRQPAPTAQTAGPKASPKTPAATVPKTPAAAASRTPKAADPVRKAAKARETGPAKPPESKTGRPADGVGAATSSPPQATPRAQDAPQPAAGVRQRSGGTPPKPPASPRRLDCSPPSGREIARIDALLRATLAEEGTLLFSTVGLMISNAVPRIGKANRWSGAETLTEFFRLYLPEFVVEPGEHDRVVRLARLRDRVRTLIGWSRG